MTRVTFGFLLALAGLLPTPARAVAPDPVDVVIYGSHLPTFTLGGTTFANPFTQTELVGDPTTRLGLEPVTGLARPLGTVGWGAVTWSKYYLIAGYDEHGGGVGQDVEDQRVGVFDTESHTYCQLDLDPSLVANAGVEFFSVANPGARQTRIFFQGFMTTGYAFGYIEADADNDTPCDPVTGWHVVGFDGDDLNAAAVLAGLPPQKQPCAVATCGLDGIGVLDHEANGRDTIVLNNWFDRKIIVAHIDAAGTLTVPDVYPVPSWKPTNTGGACYAVRPVTQPAVDRTRATGDKRFAYSYDPGCDAPVDIASCTYVGLCPLNNTSCTVGSGTCAQSYCQTPLFGSYVTCTSNASCDHVLRTCSGGTNNAALCSTDANCPGGTCGPGANLGACTNSCLPVNPRQVCSSNTSQTCAQASNCPGWVSGGSSNPTCDCKLPGQPAQEFRFDGTALTTTSGFFQGTVDHTSSPLSYGTAGELWIADSVRDTLPASAAKAAVIYNKLPGGEHSYYNTAAAGQSVIVPEDTVIGFSHDTTLSWLAQVLDLPSRAAPHPDGGSVYLASRNSIQRGVSAYGTWMRDTGYKQEIGTGILPNEPGRCIGGTNKGLGCSAAAGCPGGWCTTGNPGRCSGGSNSGNPCSTTAQCPSGSCLAVKRCAGGANADLACWANSECPSSYCQANEAELYQGFAGALDIGGSPPSAWTTANLGDGDMRHGTMNTHLIRTPVQTALPDFQSATRPGTVWSGSRLWLVSEHAGVLQYRTRDDGFWSGWFPLPSNVALTGGVALTSNGTSVRLFARGASDGLVYTTSLSSAIGCAAGTCTFANWTVIPGSPVTDAEPAATFRGANNPLVAARRASDGNILFSRQAANGTWSTWTVAKATFFSSTGPGATFHTADNKTWLIARDQSTGLVKACTIAGTGTTVSAWNTVGGSGAPATWGYTPAIEYDGSRLRAFSQAIPFPEVIYQAIRDSTGWSNWRPLPTGAISTTQPATANVNGEVHLVTKWYTDGLRQQALE